MNLRFVALLLFTSTSHSRLGEELTPSLVYNSLTGIQHRYNLSGLRRVLCVCQLERPAGWTMSHWKPPDGSRPLCLPTACLFIGLWEREARVGRLPCMWLCCWFILTAQQLDSRWMQEDRMGGSFSAFVDHLPPSHSA